MTFHTIHVKPFWINQDLNQQNSVKANEFQRQKLKKKRDPLSCDEIAENFLKLIITADET